MKRFIILLVGLICIGSSVALVRHVIPHEISPGRGLMHVTVLNDLGYSIRDAKVEIQMPTLDIYSRDSTNRIRSGKSHRFVLNVDIPDAKADYYPVYIKVYDEDGSLEKKGSWVYIG